MTFAAGFLAGTVLGVSLCAFGLLAVVWVLRDPVDLTSGGAD